MNNVSKLVGIGFVTFIFGTMLSVMAVAADRAVYDKPEIEIPGTTIYGKVVKVMEHDATKHAWEVGRNAATGEVVHLHLDKSTERKEKDPDPAIGDRVVVKYEDNSKHAITFVKDAPIKP